jgi:hypothetical protein
MQPNRRILLQKINLSTQKVGAILRFYSLQKKCQSVSNEVISDEARQENGRGRI